MSGRRTMARGGARRWGADRRGSVAPLAGLAVAATFGLTGAAVDYGRLTKAKGELQQALDAAVLAGLGRGAANAVATANAVFPQALGPETAATGTATFAMASDGSLQGRASAQVALRYAGLLGIPDVAVAARAASYLPAGSAAPAARVCLLLMEPTGPQPLLVNGNAQVKAPNCEVHVRSTGSPAAIFNGNVTWTPKRTCLKGTSVTRNGTNQLGTIETGCAAVADPYVGVLAAPASLACTSNNLTVNAPAKGKTTLLPGVYCGNTNFNGNQNIVFQPGTYVLKNGTMLVNGNSSLDGTGVTFYFADANSMLQLNGSLTVHLEAPSSGTNAGVLMYEPDGLAKTSMTINGGHGENLVGLLHLPSRNVTYNGSTSVTSDAVTMVFNTLIVNGGSAWAFDTGTKTIAADGSGTGGQSATATVALRY